MPDPTYVTWALYLDDRRARTEWESRVEDKVDRMLSRQEALELAAARDDGQEVAERAAEVAVVENRRSRRETVRDIGLATFSALLALGAGFILALLTGASPA